MDREVHGLVLWVREALPSTVCLHRQVQKECYRRISNYSCCQSDVWHGGVGHQDEPHQVGDGGGPQTVWMEADLYIWEISPSQPLARGEVLLPCVNIVFFKNKQSVIFWPRRLACDMRSLAIVITIVQSSFCLDCLPCRYPFSVLYSFLSQLKTTKHKESQSNKFPLYIRSLQQHLYSGGGSLICTTAFYII